MHRKPTPVGDLKGMVRMHHTTDRAAEIVARYAAERGANDALWALESRWV